MIFLLVELSYQLLELPFILQGFSHVQAGLKRNADNSVSIAR